MMFFVASSILIITGSASADVKPRRGEELLLETYQKNMVKLETSSFALPLFVESFERDDRVHVDVYGIFDYPFSSIVNVLKVPSNWCDIVFLHPNVKACTFRKSDNAQLLTFYFGRKNYQPPKETHLIICNYRNLEQRQGYVDISLNADKGPFGTKNHRMRFEGLPLDVGRTFVHVSYEYSDSAALRLATRIYFATLGRGKVGFTVTGMDRNAKPVYIGGARGALERSAVRYYFAIQTFITTLRYPEESRFSMRISEWFDLTYRYRKQLFDLDKVEYLASKRLEQKNQVVLQRLTGTALQ